MVSKHKPENDWEYEQVYNVEKISTQPMTWCERENITNKDIRIYCFILFNDQKRAYDKFVLNIYYNHGGY